MGGNGSGRRRGFSIEATTDNYRTLDVRWLKREGMLVHGTKRSVSWMRHGEVVSWIDLRAEPDHVFLSYHNKDGDGPWTAESYPIYLVTTPCHLGGERHWFLCPVIGCDRRVAILYGGRRYACRSCYQLAYASQRETAVDRTARKANKIRDRLGWPRGILHGSHRSKPKGMHWRTFERLYGEHQVLEQMILKDISAKISA